MKNNTISTKISSSWRNYKVETTEVKHLENIKQDSKNVEEVVVAPKVAPKSVVPSPKGVAKPPRATELQNNYKKLQEKLDKQTVSKDIDTEIMYKRDYDAVDDKRLDELLDSDNEHDRIKRKAIIQFKGTMGLCRNLNPAAPSKFDLDTKGSRRLATDFARVISKVAEDNSGDIVEGSQMWDMDKLMYRTLDNRSLTHCKSKQELESLLLILDSSPSCSSYAKTYSQIATVAANHDDIDMYNAPNARIMYKYNARKKEFVQCWTPEDIIVGAHKWTYFKNRTILFFGDSDGIRVVKYASLTNTIHWFTPYDTKYAKEIIYNRHHGEGNVKNISIYPNVHDVESFIKAVKHMK